MYIQPSTTNRDIKMQNTKHQWVCDDCDYFQEFRQPELPQDDIRSEQNEDGPECPYCCESMYFEPIKDEGAEIVEAVKKYADNDREHGWHEVNHNGKVYRLPKRALIWYVLGQTKAIIDRLPEYEPISPHSYKLQNDNRYHTDVMFGAFGTADNTYGGDGPENEVLHQAQIDIEKEFSDLVRFDFVVLANTLDLEHGWADFMVYEHECPVDENSNISIYCAKARENRWEPLRAICIPHAGVEFDLAAKNADVIITERGGKLCHLATVARESGKLLIRVDNATKFATRFTRFHIDLNQLSLKATSR